MFDEELKVQVEAVEKIIMEYMPKEYSFQKTVIDAMNYTMSAGGKRIRPLLMEKTYEFFGGNCDYIKPFMAAIEMIHTYSLIHDDLPALDNDEYRRGRKTAHVVYGEAMAILAGDSLLNYAFETAAKAFDMIESSNEQDLGEVLQELNTRKQMEKALSVLTRNPGIYGMIGGQVADVELTGTKLSGEQLEYIYVNKTGALIEACLMIGTLLAGVSDGRIEKMKKVAYNVGMAFQIQDDILDVTSTTKELGKPVLSDEKNNKFTYVTLLGLEGAKEYAEVLSQCAIKDLSELPYDTEFVKALIDMLINRQK